MKIESAEMKQNYHNAKDSSLYEVKNQFIFDETSCTYNLQEMKLKAN